ncbi:U-box domain-containing protein 21 [Rhynchospora pubera]|uniref:U-box domain-containing protein n=1 Tax=Rhynchospora pubera TaxID=906938 RepID=A0AAV8H4X5_9POAL|nr:U-box domain-containing protein 21 [Rhynchospora pubera]
MPLLFSVLTHIKPSQFSSTSSSSKNRTSNSSPSNSNQLKEKGKKKKKTGILPHISLSCYMAPVQKSTVKSLPFPENVPIPTHFRCPISLDLMRDPVITSTGITYDRQSIEKWLEMGNKSCPATNQQITQDELIPNHALRRLIQDWCVTNRAMGIERIPTPRIPLSKIQATEILSEISSSSIRGDGVRCSVLVTKLKALGKESERNKLCVTSCGGSQVLAAAFREFAGEGIEGAKLGLLEEIMSALIFFSPLDKGAMQHLISLSCSKSIVSILNHGNLAGMINSVMLLRKLVSSMDAEAINSFAKTSGLVEGLVKLVQRPISSQATKAALATIYYLVSADERLCTKFVDLGLVSSLLEILIDCDKSICEKALGVLEGLFSSDKGSERACQHALTVPVLIKKLLRVSDLATHFSVSALWKLCKKGNCCVVEALQAGLFQKLLLLVQVGCNTVTKEKVSDLLKVLNSSRSSVECVETVDFRGINRPF